jgi:diadenosine tetraphosphatase ApaH/serine/threonine PP2A family protein phosphatase
MRERAIVNLMGNHDYYLVDDVPCPRSKSANASLEWQRRAITPQNLAWLAQSPRKGVRNGKLSMVHAGWNDPIDEYMEAISAEYFASREGDVFVSGHTHVQGIWPVGAKTYCNPGSVGQPRDGDPRAAFATWDGAEMHLHRVDYDIDEIAAHMQASGFGAHFYENLKMGVRIGGKLSQIRVV